MGVKMDIELRSSGECMEMAEKVGELPTESSRVRIRVKWKGKEPRAASFQRNSHDRWNSPPAEYVKVNFDVWYDTITKSSITWVIIGESEGLILANNTCHNSHSSSPVIVEVWACDQTVALTSDIDFRIIIVESDAWSVIKKVRDFSIDMSHTFGLIRNIKRRSRDFE
ncbi:hypothetical protein V6N12_051162 [Hibiscus sabdariffa]|uniref:RNase H type-1 domain-containing protein n=1 Tax=Hibiscus sabdariffa TaxID=183260 RepID=A0ABR2GF04_9ROSI